MKRNQKWIDLQALVGTAEAVEKLNRGPAEPEHDSGRSSEEERKGNALASGADEGRDKLRKASGSCK